MQSNLSDSIINKSIYKSLFILLLLSQSLIAQNYADIVVDANGSGDFKTITEAINAFPMYQYQRAVIFIKNGIYEEHIRIDQNYVTLRGESRDSTIIRYNLPREEWNNNKDWIGPGVVNLEGDDIILDNLTIENSQPEIGPHAFAVYGLNPNRTIIINCNILSKGGDTVSLWNYKEGMYYHANCYFQGAVDFVCPRGWCFIRNSQFYEVKETATLWHAGNYNPDQKFILRNCSFDGVKGFELGRHHYQAQFFLLNCSFSENMKNKPIYKVYDKDPDHNNPFYAGERDYYFNCSKKGEQYDWYKNNLDQASGQPTPDEITPEWTFRGKWNPEESDPIYIKDYEINGDSVIFTFSEIVTVRGEPVIETTSEKRLKIVKQRYNDINKLSFRADSNIIKSDLEDDLILKSGDIIASIAYTQDRSIGKSFSIHQFTTN
jgi:pectinesterase